MSTHIVFGGQGFIGQNLALYLLDLGDRVISIDMNVWSIPYMDEFKRHQNNFSSYTADIVKNSEQIMEFIKSNTLREEHCIVWHLAANSDISAGVNNIETDLKDTLLTTVNIVNICDEFSFKSLCFASSSAVYGAWAKNAHAYTEDDKTVPISNYGAMKLASEAVLSSASEHILEHVEVFRFPNVIGAPATHGVIRDFIFKLRKDNYNLAVLGDGKQTKPYLHVSDLVDAMCFLALKKPANGYRVCNIGAKNANVSVEQIANLVVSEISPTAGISFGSTPGGWIGDVPKVFFDTSQIDSLGWHPKYDGLSAVRKTILELKGITK